MKKVLLISFLLVYSSFFSTSYADDNDSGESKTVLASGVFNSDVVGEASFSGIEDCLQYCITGICIYLVCSIYECHLEYTAQVEHNLPDLVVSAYRLPGDIAYEESKEIYGAISEKAAKTQLGYFGFLAGGGDRLETIEKRSHSKNNRKVLPTIYFKEVNVVGSPFVEKVSEQLRRSTQGYICESEVEPFDYVFSSEVDAIAWRFGLTELFYTQTWNPTARILGTPLVNYWGRVYPRQGFLGQRNDAKAGHVMSYRAIDISTRDDQPHIYSQAAVDKSHESYKRWQLLAPTTEDTCRAVGDDVDFGVVNDQLSNDGKYGWLYWGRHQCCGFAPGILIAEIEITEICT